MLLVYVLSELNNQGVIGDYLSCFSFLFCLQPRERKAWLQTHTMNAFFLRQLRREGSLNSCLFSPNSSPLTCCFLSVCLSSHDIITFLIHFLAPITPVFPLNLHPKSFKMRIHLAIKVLLYYRILY